MPFRAARRFDLPVYRACAIACVLTALPAAFAQSPRGEMFSTGPEQAEGMADDGTGNLYIAAANGLFRHANGTITRMDAAIGTPVSLAYDRQLWIGANRGLWSFDGRAFTAHAQVQGGTVFELVPGPDNLLLLNVGDGPYTASAWIHLARLENGKIRSIVKLAPASRFHRPAFDSKGNIYYLSRQNIYFLPANRLGAVFQGGGAATAIPTPKLGSRNAALLVSDGSGGMWAFGGGALAHYRDGEPTEAPRTDFPFDPIPGIGPQACMCNGTLWFISKFNLFTVQRGTIYRWHPEPATRALTIRGIHCDSANALWMGLNAGVRKIPTATQPGSVPFLLVQAGGSSWTSAANAPTRFPYGNHTIRADLSIPVLLPAGVPNSTRYRFRLLGMEDEWSVTSAPEFAFAAAQPGQYRLEADIEINGQWSQQPAVYAFEIDSRPHSPWLWPLAAAAVAASAAAAWLWRRRRRESVWGIPDTMLGQRYRIVERIAETNISYVFRARDTKLANRPVVLKVIRRIAVHREAIATFRREVEALSRLRHRGIVNIQDVGVLNDGRPFLVMELIEGESLRALLHRGPFPPARAGRVLAQLGQTIAIAHANGIIHRDLKPENLMLEFPGTDRENLVILDFGTARIANPDSTIESVSGGTLDYMAPEQLFGHSSERTDIYAAALVTFEMLTAKRLTELMCENPTEVEPALRRELNAVTPALAPAAIDVILQAANPDPAKRPQDIESWSRELSAQLVDYANFGRDPYAE